MYTHHLCAHIRRVMQAGLYYIMHPVTGGVGCMHVALAASCAGLVDCMGRMMWGEGDGSSIATWQTDSMHCSFSGQWVRLGARFMPDACCTQLL